MISHQIVNVVGFFLVSTDLSALLEGVCHHIGRVLTHGHLEVGVLLNSILDADLNTIRQLPQLF